MVSPLLANVALNGIEKIGQSYNKGKFTSKCVRYADDMVFFLNPEDNATQILDEIKEFLSCAACKLKFTSEERVHLHHVDGNHDNWRWNNLVAIHQSCHDYQHMSKSQG